jgi:hypothetical protein
MGIIAKSSDFLDAINDTNLFGTVSQIAQKFPLLRYIHSPVLFP